MVKILGPRVPAGSAALPAVLAEGLTDSAGFGLLDVLAEVLTALPHEALPEVLLARG